MAYTAGAQYFTTQLSVVGGINATQTTGIILQDVSRVSDLSKPSIVAISWNKLPDGSLDTSVVEFIGYKSINAQTNELQGVVRGLDGFSAKAHNNGAIIAYVISASHINGIFDSVQPVNMVSTDPDNQAHIGSDGKIFVPSMGSISVPDNYFFTSDTARDEYFTSHQEELQGGIYAVVNSMLQQYKATGWTNMTVAIRGPRGVQGVAGAQGLRGQDGQGLQILGIYATLGDLQADHATGNPGDAYAVGTSTDNLLYIWDVKTSTWAEIGTLNIDLSLKSVILTTGAGNITDYDTTNTISRLNMFNNQGVNPSWDEVASCATILATENFIKSVAEMVSGGTNYAVTDELTVTLDEAEVKVAVTSVDPTTAAITGFTQKLIHTGATTGTATVTGGSGTGASFNINLSNIQKTKAICQISDYTVGNDDILVTASLVKNTAAYDQENVFEKGALIVDETEGKSYWTKQRALAGTPLTDEDTYLPISGGGGGLGTSGWSELTSSAVLSEWDGTAKTATITFPLDLSTAIWIGQKIKLIQDGVVHYFYVTSVDGATATLLAYDTLANGNVTDISNSIVAIPSGFPSDFTMLPSSGGVPAPLVPNMTSASTPAPFLVTTSDNIANPGYPWQAFGGGSYHLFDHQQYSPFWTSIVLNKKYYLKQYKVNFNGGRAPSSYQILGSNDGVDWYEIIGITGNTVEQVIKSVVTDVAYSQYRINMLSGNPSNGQKPGIVNLQYYGVPA